MDSWEVAHGGSTYLSRQRERILGEISHPEYGYLRSYELRYGDRDVRMINNAIASELGELIYLSYDGLINQCITASCVFREQMEFTR